MKRFVESDFPQNGFEAWGGYRQAKVSKLEDQFSTTVNKESQISNLFNGVSIFVNGYTKPSSYELKALMIQHGGVYHAYQRNEDYTIASNLPDTKVKNQSLSRVVKPEWITESIAANKLLDYRNYLLYNEIINQPKLQFGKSDSIKSEIEFVNDKSQENVLNTNGTDIDITLKPIKIIKKSQGKDMCVMKQSETTKTAVDPNFISEFYNNSRLHHISQLGASFKQLINDLRDCNDFLFSARLDLRNKLSKCIKENSTVSEFNFLGGRIIMHIDMDCFFVSVGIRGREELKGKPIAVTHAKSGQQIHKRPGTDRETEFKLYRNRIAKSLQKVTGSSEGNELGNIKTKIDNIMEEDTKYGSMSEIASCSYEARAKGVNNGMFLGAALKLCPNLVTIPYDFDGYKEVAFTLYNTVAKYTLDIEAVSCDEMYVDCTDLLKCINVSVPNFASALRKEIKEKTGCPCSTGFGGNKLQARLATKLAKPDGQYFLTSDLVDEFMIAIKLRDLPGVGQQTSKKLEMLGHETCGSLQTLSLAMLQKHLGNKTGSLLHDQCRGIDNQPLTFYNVRKSVSAEVNYGIRFENNEHCINFLRQIAAEVHNRMIQFKVLGKCITLKMMVRAEEAPVETAKFMGQGFCNTINKSVTLAVATNDLNIITKEVLDICKNLKIDPREMRGVGIQITKLEPLESKNKIGGINKFLIPKTDVKHEIPPNQENSKDLIKTTPKKVKIASPKNKSPIIGLTKSPIKRKRKNLLTKFQTDASNNIMNKFLQGNSSNNNTNELLYSKIELSETVVTKTENTHQNENGLSDLPWKTVREMLRAWLNNDQPPLQCDVTFLVNYLGEMVIKRKTGKVEILLRFLGRKTELGSDEWRKVYNQILDEVQNVTLGVFGMKLHL